MEELRSRFYDGNFKNGILEEYPRPQFERESYFNLNGLWEYSISKSDRIPDKYDGKILVPFSPESKASGVMRKLMPDEFLFYKRKFALPEGFLNERVLLNFGAIDRHATVYVNSKEVFRHSGGYTPFSTDITDYLFENENEIAVKVKDETDSLDNGSRGKQKLSSGGIFYSCQSGIWQSVFLESVPENYIASLRITPDYDNSKVEIYVSSPKKSTCFLIFEGKTYGFVSNGNISLTIKGFIPWSPENPHLYNFEVRMGNDSVKSYFGMRKISLGKDENGKTRVFLNNKPYFLFGVLDQGYHCDGLYTQPSDEEMIFDIETAKKCGFNMLRKHAKVEPLRFYYHCDRLGMIVFQDIVNGGGKYKFGTVTLPLFTGKHKKDSKYVSFSRDSLEGRSSYLSELSETLNTLYNSPSVLEWTLFNEGWGQFDSAKISERVKAVDPSRLIDHASGWHDQSTGDFYSTHVYFKKYRYKEDKKDRAVFVSEFGGYSMKTEGHTFGDKNFGYKKYKDKESLTRALSELFVYMLETSFKNGISAIVYTQLTDIEDELNGILTYDRKVIKPDIDILSGIVNKYLKAFNQNGSERTKSDEQ